MRDKTMAEPRRQFEVVEDEPTPDPRPDPKEQAGMSLLLLGLRSLSQRALAALDNLIFLVTVASVFYLWAQIPDPNTFQIVALIIYAAFILAVNFLMRRGK
jgi:hypothetical protein